MSTLDDDELRRLLAPLKAPSPRRNDAAFAHAVETQLRRKTPRLLWPAALATGAVALALSVGRALPTESHAQAASVEDRRAAELVSMELAWDLGEGAFAFPSLEGSSVDELAALDRALDRALVARAR